MCLSVTTLTPPCLCGEGIGNKLGGDDGAGGVNCNGGEVDGSGVDGAAGGGDGICK